MYIVDLLKFFFLSLQEFAWNVVAKKQISCIWDIKLPSSLSLSLSLFLSLSLSLSLSFSYAQEYLFT